MPAKKIATTPTPAPAKKAAAKTAPVKKAPAKKAAAKKTAASKTPSAVATPAAGTPLTREQIDRAAYLNFRDRNEKGLAGDHHTDWIEAERTLKTT